MFRVSLLMQPHPQATTLFSVIQCHFPWENLTFSFQCLCVPGVDQSVDWIELKGNSFPPRHPVFLPTEDQSLGGGPRTPVLRHLGGRWLRFQRRWPCWHHRGCAGPGGCTPVGVCPAFWAASPPCPTLNDPKKTPDTDGREGVRCLRASALSNWVWI